MPKIAALARHADEIVVLADTALPDALPPNAHAHSFAASSKVARGLRFERALAQEIRGADGVVAHMCPIYAVLAAPIARPLGKPVVLWFTHPQASRTLRAAEKVVTAVASVDRASFPFTSRKLHAIGHGIDVSEFECTGSHGGLRLLALGRYGDVKGLDEVLRGVRIAVDRGLDVRLDVRGPGDPGSLPALVDELGLGDRVELGAGVPRSEVPALFARADALVNNTRSGSADKVVFEAAAACLPVLASSAALAGFLAGLGLHFNGAGELAERLGSLDGRVGPELRHRVERDHSVDSWAKGILSLL